MSYRFKRKNVERVTPNIASLLIPQKIRKFKNRVIPASVSTTVAKSGYVVKSEHMNGRYIVDHYGEIVESMDRIE